MIDVDTFLEAAHERLLRDKTRSDVQLTKAIAAAVEHTPFRLADQQREDRGELIIHGFHDGLGVPFAHVIRAADASVDPSSPGF